MRKTGLPRRQAGQALIALLFFVLMAVGISTASIFVVSSNSLSTSDLQEATLTRQMADAGIEVGTLALLRNPDYTGETITIDSGTVVITVSGVTTKTITAEATNGNFVKKIEFIVDYADNVLIPMEGSWKEID